ncbi:ABC transporter substrate-binding protein [Streptomyces sp. NPDC001744]|uniref:ABC transporter substrate-binding protein n=1 Tax=Streptomyces sp. NPDC001744 TaxID=3364606 RepID=UPI003682C213
MSGAQAWEFTDDRGEELRADHVPRRVVAYVRAGAALYDLGVTPVAVYGSGHDGDTPDPAKAGILEAVGVPYLGPGRGLDEEGLGALRPDLVVDVTYDGKDPYALDGGLAARIGVPLAVLSVGGGSGLRDILGRFDALAAGLTFLGPNAGHGEAGGREAAGPHAAHPEGAGPETVGPETGYPVTASPATGLGRGAALAEFASAEAALREAVVRTGLGVLALSGAGPDEVHLARPRAWPELAWLSGIGVRMIDPGPGPGANWLTTDWERAAGLRPDLVLFDNRGHATPPYGLPSGVRLVPWNPETPPSPAAYARFLRDLAEVLAP